MKLKQPFFARAYRWFFNRCIVAEIFHQIFPHLNQKEDFSDVYQFTTRAEMNELTEKHDINAALEVLEEKIRQMQDASGESFRYIMHRDMCERLRLYAEVGERYVDPQKKWAAAPMKLIE